jgi:carbon-monoxide dehydrogenase medium subunit
VKPAPFTYHDPTTVGELVSLLASLEDAKLLAGGQSLMPMLNLRLVQPDHVVDLNTVAGLDRIEPTATGVRVGSMVRQAALADSHELVTGMPAMGEALHWVGNFQTRNRGTIGGSLSHLDPAAELPAISLLHDAELTVEGPQGTRTVSMREWPLGYMTPNLDEDEILTSLEFRYWTEPHGYAFEEFARRYGDFALVAVGALLAVCDGDITRAAVAIAGAQPTPTRLDEVEVALVGQPARADTFREAAHIAKQRDAMSDSYTDSGYRQRLVGVLTERTLAKAAARAPEEGG